MVYYEFESDDVIRGRSIELHGEKNVHKKQEHFFQWCVSLKSSSKICKTNVLLFYASIREQIGSNGILSISFYKKQRSKKRQFQYVLGSFVPTTFFQQKQLPLIMQHRGPFESICHVLPVRLSQHPRSSTILQTYPLHIITYIFLCIQATYGIIRNDFFYFIYSKYL